MSKSPPFALVVLLASTALFAIAADMTARSTDPYVPRQSDRPSAIEGDEPGFTPIFDGHSLNGWEGNPVYWRVENGSIVGEITPDTLVKSNTFIVWRSGQPEDFELKLDYRITSAGNSGINYRSARITDPITPGNNFALRGYQFDLDGENKYTGNNYEEKGRLFLALRGQLTRVVGGRPPILLSALGNQSDLESAQKTGWNSAHLIVRGNVFLHLLNGQLMSVVIDDDPHRLPKGEIGVQVHIGPPMKVEYRNIRLKALSESSP